MADNYIEINNLVHKGIYEIKARNFSYGIWDENIHGFYGVRYKFGSRFIDIEYHWDLCETYGTVKPLQFINDYKGDINDYELMFSVLDSIRK